MSGPIQPPGDMRELPEVVMRAVLLGCGNDARKLARMRATLEDQRDKCRNQACPGCVVLGKVLAVIKERLAQCEPALERAP